VIDGWQKDVGPALEKVEYGSSKKREQKKSRRFVPEESQGKD